MPLAIFDLDNTLLAGDSDYLWGRFLSETGAVDGATYERENLRFFQQYQTGSLDIHEFLRFSLRPLKENPMERLLSWREAFLQTKIDPIITQAALDLVNSHRQAGDTLLIITATNSFVTQPIAARLGIPHLIGTDPEMKRAAIPAMSQASPVFVKAKWSGCVSGCRHTHWIFRAAPFTATRTTISHCWIWSTTRLRWIRMRSWLTMPQPETGRLSRCATHRTRHRVESASHRCRQSILIVIHPANRRDRQPTRRVVPHESQTLFSRIHRANRGRRLCLLRTRESSRKRYHQHTPGVH